MEIDPTEPVCALYEFSALVLLVADAQRLMDVADEVNDETQSVRLFINRRGASEYCDLLFNRSQHTTFCCAVALSVDRCSASWNVQEMLCCSRRIARRRA